jgi:hypothetical protein
LEIGFTIVTASSAPTETTGAMTVARAKSTHRLRRLQDEPSAPNLPRPECGPTAGTTDEPSVLSKGCPSGPPP